MSTRGKSKERAALAAGSSMTVALKSPPGIEVEATEQEARDPVPGKITDREWKDLIAVDEGIEIVYEIIDEIVEDASSIVLNNFVANEIYPYAVEDAKNQILRALALEFVARDEGERNTDTDPTWLPDTPPVPPPIDSWACGMIPLATADSLHTLVDALEPIHVHQPESSEPEKLTTTLSTTIKTTTESMTSISKSSLNRYRRRKRQSQTLSTKSSRPQVVMTPLDPPLPELDESLTEVTPIMTEEKQVSPPRPKQRVPVNTTEPPTAHPRSSEDSQQSYTPFGLTPVQVSRMKDISFDKHGKVVRILKLDPEKFSSHSIAPSVTVIRESGKKPASPIRRRTFKPPLPRNTKGKKGSLNKAPLQRPLPLPKKGMGVASKKGTAAEEVREVLTVANRHHHAGRTVTVMPSDAGLTKKMSEKRFPSTPALPSIIDTIDPLPGVTVREGGRSVHGPTPTFQPPATPTGPLRPVKLLGPEKGGVASRGKAEKQYRTAVYT